MHNALSDVQAAIVTKLLVAKPLRRTRASWVANMKAVGAYCWMKIINSDMSCSLPLKHTHSCKHPAPMCWYRHQLIQRNLKLPFATKLPGSLQWLHFFVMDSDDLVMVHGVVTEMLPVKLRRNSRESRDGRWRSGCNNKNRKNKTSFPVIVLRDAELSCGKKTSANWFQKEVTNSETSWKGDTGPTGNTYVNGHTCADQGLSETYAVGLFQQSSSNIPRRKWYNMQEI